MKIQIRKLEPIGALDDSWKCVTVKTTLSGLSDSEIKYEGEVLTTTATGGTAIEFELITRVFRPALIEIPLLVGSETAVHLFVDGKVAGDISLPAKGDTSVQVISSDLTRFCQSSRTSKLKVQFLRDSGAAITLLTDDRYPELKPRLIQSWDLAHAFPALSFYCLFALCLLGLVILLPAHLQFLSKSLRFYTIVGGAIIWLIGILGVVDLAKIPVASTLRKFYGRTEAMREIVLLSLALSSFLILTGVIVALLGMRARQKYSDLIVAAIDGPKQNRDQAIRDAFIAVPWRKEAQILFENRAYELRDASDMGSFRRYVAAFVSDPSIAQAIRNVQNEPQLPFYLRKDTKTFSNPFTWYASLWLEAENTDQARALREALNMLSVTSEPEALVQSGYMKLSLVNYDFPAKGDQSQIADWQRRENATADKLQKLLTTYEADESVVSDVAFQNACDALAVHYVNQCDVGNAVKWFKKEIHVRDQMASLSDERLWLRPPEKLILFYLLCANCTTTGGGKVSAEAVQNQYAKCLAQTANAQSANQPTPSLAKIILADYAAYADRGAWRKNTFLDDKAKGELKTEMLEKGWRY
jgi:hypothetical protein